MQLSSRRVDITPKASAQLAASPHREPSRGVAEPLEANLLLLRDGDQAVAIATLDLLYPGRRLRRVIEDSLAGLGSECILVGASHTHSAPPTFEGKEGLGRLDEEYVGHVSEVLSEALTDLMIAEPAKVEEWSVAIGDLEHSINRRRPTRRGVRMAPNPQGPTDERATLIVASGQGRPMAVMWNYACHPVSHPHPAQIASHYPHVVRSTLRAAFDAPELPVLFLQGFSGDTRPSATTKIRTLRDVALRLRLGKGFFDMNDRAYAQWSRSLARKVLELSSAMQKVVLEGIKVRRVAVPLTEFVGGGTEGSEVFFQRLTLGKQVSIVGVSAEVVSEYAPWVRGLFPAGHTTLCVGCTDESYGYLPTAEMLAEGGYEADGFCSAFGYSGVRNTIDPAAREALRRICGS